MKKKITVGNKQYVVEIADTLELQKKGLQDKEYLAPDEGMLFVYPKQQNSVEFWMKDTKIPLDQIAINDDDEVTFVYRAMPNDETLVPFANVKYLLEVNQNSGIVEGDDFDIEDEDMSKYVMKVLAPDGTTQMWLQGGERIISRKETKVLIHKAKVADAVKDTEEFDRKCKALGKYLFKVLHGQDHRDPEYVQAPKKENSDQEQGKNTDEDQNKQNSSEQN